MDYQLVIVRAVGGRPVRRTAIGSNPTHVYVANPDLIQAVESGESGPIGFPRFDVFFFEEQMFRELDEQWTKCRRTETGSWNQLIPFSG